MSAYVAMSYVCGNTCNDFNVSSIDQTLRRQFSVHSKVSDLRILHHFLHNLQRKFIFLLAEGTSLPLTKTLC